MTRLTISSGLGPLEFIPNNLKPKLKNKKRDKKEVLYGLGPNLLSKTMSQP